MHVLVTGGAGFIGSFTSDLLIKSGHKVTIIDNLSTGHLSTIPAGAQFFQADITDYSSMLKIFLKEKFDGLIHFAAKSLVGESVQFPLKYYENNFLGTLNLVKACKETAVTSIVFSSTAAVYGEPTQDLNEEHPKNPINPYGNSKLAVENLIKDVALSSENSTKLHCIALRYFNACGGHQEGEMGEDHEPETHLIPLVVGAALGKRPALQIFGNDYPTADGTAVRDYIDVRDLADAHLLALMRCSEQNSDTAYFEAFNVGTGLGNSVAEVIAAAEKVLKIKVPHQIGPRRPGDPAKLVANSLKIQSELTWKAKTTLEDSIDAVFKFQTKYPQGYSK